MGIPRVFWSCLAAAQAAAWFFLLPIVCKSHWVDAWALVPHALHRQVLLNSLGLFYFVGYSIVMLPIYAGNFAFFEQFKISAKPWAWRSDKREERDAFWALSARSVKLFCLNFGFLLPVLTAGKFVLLGDTMSFDVEDWPSYPTLFLDNVAMTLAHEFFFYWCHRLAHHPKLYKYHKIHHEYKQNNILASQHEHPIDYIVTIATPGLMAIAIVGPHSFTLFQWIAWVLMANIDDHVGYAFPWSPVRWFPFAGTTEMHEFHHSKNMGCFASKLSINDWAFNSLAPYRKWKAKGN